MTAAAPAPEGREALVPQAEDRVRLGAGRDAQRFVPPDRGNRDFGAQYGLRKADGGFAEDVAFLSAQSPSRPDMDPDVEITGWPATGAGFPFARDA